MDAWVLTSVLIVYLWLPRIIRLGFTIFQCDAICGKIYLTLDSTEECYVNQHLVWALGIALPALCVYIVIVPSIALLYLSHHRHELDSNATVNFRFGLLFGGYSVDRGWWWELVSLIRKVSIILFVTFARGSQFQLHFAMVVLVFLLFAQERGRPFHSGQSTVVALRVGQGWSGSDLLRWVVDCLLLACFTCVLCVD